MGRNDLGKCGMNRRQFLSQCGNCVFICASPAILPVFFKKDSANAALVKKGAIGRKLSPYFTPLSHKAVRCDLCPHQCEVKDGQRGLCEVRENIDGRYFSLVYGNPCAVNIDPIEKKPFYHVLPATKALSVATAGCNFDCKFCVNWEIAQARPEDTYNYLLKPNQIVSQAVRYGCHAIASGYVEPVVFMEYMIEIGRQTRAFPLLKIMHSNGFMNEKPLMDLCNYLDAACVDLKGFTEDFYQDMAEGSLRPVLETLKRLKAGRVHIEIVNLIIPGKNDDMAHVHAMCHWIRDELGPDVPLHFLRFYPRYKLKGIAPTPVKTLEQARSAALAVGLNFVYIGNIPKHPGAHTYCPQCEKMLIKRIGYNVKVLALKNGKCLHCGRPVPGIWKQRQPGA
ncbi:AmmeMemoRadiSam system radical SAM enzyme [Thermodesulfobacteriota bacterium]